MAVRKSASMVAHLDNEDPQDLATEVSKMSSIRNYTNYSHLYILLDGLNYSNRVTLSDDRPPLHRCPGYCYISSLPSFLSAINLNIFIY